MLFPRRACISIRIASFNMVVCWPWMLHPAGISLQGAVEGADSRDLPFVLATAPANQEAHFVVCLPPEPVLQNFCTRGVQRAWASTLLRQRLQDGCKFCKSMSLTFFAAE